MQLFDGVTGVLFVAAMSGYDQKMFEDNTANRLEESLKLWEEISNLKQFTDSALVLLLNKVRKSVSLGRNRKDKTRFAF